MKKLTLLLLSISFFLSSFAQTSHGPKAFLGVESNKIHKAKAEALKFDNPYGAYVTEIIENSAAEQNGLQPFDYLTGIGDRPFSSNRSFHHAMQELKAGEQSTVQFIRDGQQMSVPLTFGKQSDAIYRKIPKEEEPFFGVKQDHYNWREKVPGVKVNVVNNSAAEAMGLEDEDIITTINGKQIVDWHDLATAIDNMTPGETITVNYLRDDQEQTGSTVIKSYGETYQSSNHHSSKEEKQEEEEEEEVVETESILDDLDVEVDMEDVTQEEADDMKEKVGVDMPIINNLEIEKLNVFPNPTDGIFNLTFDLPNQGQTTIRLFNSVGRLIYQNEMQQFSGFFKDRVDISNGAKGIYFLEVNQDGKSISKKIILQ